MAPVREYMHQNANNHAMMEKGRAEVGLTYNCSRHKLMSYVQGYSLRLLIMEDFFAADPANALTESFIVRDRSQLDIDQ